jgi:translation elongation factor EF-1alpha
VPVLPISGWMGDNLNKKSTNMGWWSGTDVLCDATKSKLHLDTLYDALNQFCSPPGRNVDAPMRLPVSGIYKIKGVGDVLAGRVEQGVVKPNEEVVFMPTHTTANACAGKVFTIEMHHTRHEKAEISFRPQQPLLVDSFKRCEGLSRIAFIDGNTAVMLGKVTSVIFKSAMPAEEKKKKK